MGDGVLSRVWLMRASFVLLSLLIIFCHLLPLDTVPRRWAPPDLLMAFTFAWALRRPDYVPVIVIAAVMLTADLLFQRPPGLMAALVLLASEYLRSRFGGLRDASFVGEWVAVCLMIAGVAVANRLVLTVLVVDVAPPVLVVIQAVMTMVAYPVVVLITRSVMGVRKPTPSDTDAFGSRV